MRPIVLKGMKKPAACHPERSEGSRQFEGPRTYEQLQRSFAALRMTPSEFPHTVSEEGD
jgi:hypothetical protein